MVVYLDGWTSKKHGLNTYCILIFGRYILFYIEIGEATKKTLQLKRKDVIWCIYYGTDHKTWVLMVNESNKSYLKP
jgi:hypothetical protein